MEKMPFEADPLKNEPQREAVKDIGPMLFKSSTGPDEIDRLVWISLKQGNRKALDYIFEKHIRLLYAYGGKIWKDGDLVEDCIQDVFVELWNKREKLSLTDNIKFYLFKSLRRRIVRKLSEGHREKLCHEKALCFLEGMEGSFESHLIEQQSSFEQQNQLEEAMARLSKRQKEAIYMKFYERMTYEQMAEVLEIDLKSSYKLVGKAIDVLRKCIRWGF